MTPEAETGKKRVIVGAFEDETFDEFIARIFNMCLRGKDHWLREDLAKFLANNSRLPADKAVQAHPAEANCEGESLLRTLTEPAPESPAKGENPVWSAYMKEHPVDELAQRVIDESPHTMLSAAYRETARRLYDTINPIGRSQPAQAIEIPDATLDEEIGRWQKAIYDLVRKNVPHPDSIDGGGCDSGDSLDFTLDEIAQGFAQIKEVNAILEQRIKELESAK